MTRPTLIWLITTLLAGGALMAAFSLGLQSAVGFGGCAIASILLLTFRDIFEASHQLKAREEKMRQVADRLNFSFRATAPFNVLDWSESFHLTRAGMKTQRAVEDAISPRFQSVLLPKSASVFEQTMDGATVAIFDYFCDKPHTEDVTMRQTVFAVRSPRLGFPYLSLLPANLWHRLADWFRGNAADLGGYRLTTDDAGSVNTLHEPVLGMLDGKLCVEAGEGILLVYRRETLVEPDDIEELLALGLRIYSVLELPEPR